MSTRRDLEHSYFPGKRIICPTRRTVRAETLNSNIENYGSLSSSMGLSLGYVEEQEIRSRIRGVALCMQTFDFLGYILVK